MQHQPPPPFTTWLTRLVGKTLARLFYRVTAHGVESLPEGGFLLLPNHLTWIDAFILSLACPRPIKFLIYDDFYRNPVLQPFLRALGCVPISEKRAKDAIRIASALLAKGEVVCIFPEGSLSRSGSLLKLRRGYELIARQAKCPVVPAWMDRLWGSIFSFRGGRFFWKWPQRWFRNDVMVAFGKPMAPREASVDMVRQRCLELSEYCYSRRPFLRGHLADACLRGLARHPGDVMVSDGMDGSSLTRSRVLAVGLALAQWVRRNVKEQRVGIVLPAGKGAILANLGVVLAGKVPVNLNFTAGRAATEASIRKAGLKTCLTAGVVAAKLKDFPWPERMEKIEEVLPALKASIVTWLALSKILPAGLLGRLARVPRNGDAKPGARATGDAPPESAEAFLLFTSGSSGEPKGVPLTHRNLLANTRQFGEMLDLGRQDILLGALPFFHSFGATVCLLFPLTEGVKVVTYPNPLDAAKCAALVAEHGATVMLATPTFLRGYMKRAHREQFASVKLLVTGAEKLPNELADAFREKFGVEVMQGYGLTETSPAASFNMPDPPVPDQPSHRQGSCGKLLPGLAACIRNPETDAPMSMFETGMLWFKGPNIFTGYLDQPEMSAQVLDKDGWFRTGDLGRFDEDGFLFIEGRISRFSKIGGEMVPHETVEAQIVESLDLSSEGERVVAVTGVSDPVKGEALVLLSTRDIDLKDLREKLNAAGMTNLWVPKRIQRVEKIPILASGKLDLQACKKAAEEGEK